MYQLIKQILFCLPAETAHYFTTGLARIICNTPILKSIIQKSFSVEDKVLAKKIAGLTFKNPVGLAAGFDKNANYLHTLSKLGFGFVEIGTVTPLPQVGNPKPRLFRLPKDLALINRMGFNNDGVDKVVERLKKRPQNIIIGGNIGKNKDTLNDNAVLDYLICFYAMHEYVDYFVVNVSSPNTPGLRALQEKEPLLRILQSLQEKNNEMACLKPIFLKIAPDLNENQLQDIVSIIETGVIEGIICTNTTIDRSNLNTDKKEIDTIGNGGLSGVPVRDKSNFVLSFIRQRVSSDFPIIGVGGIIDSDSALEKFSLGADLIQVYSGWIYAGPKLIQNILKRIIQSHKKS